jgi:hypothetical protein
VVWDGVNDDAHAEPLRLAGERVKSIRATDFRIEPSVIGHVIAMTAALARLHYRRSVAVAYAEQVEIFDYRNRVDKREIAVELKTVCS